MPHKLLTFALFLFLLTPISFTLAQPTDPPTCDFAGCTGYTGDSSELSLDRILDYAQNGGDTDQLILDALTEAQKDQVTNAAEGRGPTGGLVPCSGLDCNMCSAVSFIDAIVKWIIGIMMVIFAIIVAYAGFKLVTSGGNPEAKTSAKKMFTNTIIGLLIVLSAWILVDTLLRALLPGEAGELNGGPFWSEIQCATQVSTVTSLPEGNVSFVDRNRENRPTEFVSTFDPGVPGSGGGTGNTFNFSGNPTGDPTAGCGTAGVDCYENMLCYGAGRINGNSCSNDSHIVSGEMAAGTAVYLPQEGRRNNETDSFPFEISNNSNISIFSSSDANQNQNPKDFTTWISDTAGGSPISSGCIVERDWFPGGTGSVGMRAYVLDGFQYTQGTEDFLNPDIAGNFCIIEKGRTYFYNELMESSGAEDPPEITVRRAGAGISFNEYDEQERISSCRRTGSRRGEECWNLNYRYEGPPAPAGLDCEATDTVICGSDLTLSNYTTLTMAEGDTLADQVYVEDMVYRRKVVIPDNGDFAARIDFRLSARGAQPLEWSLIPANSQGSVIDTTQNVSACYRGGILRTFGVITTRDTDIHCQVTPGATYFLDILEPISDDEQINSARNISVTESVEILDTGSLIGLTRSTLVEELSADSTTEADPGCPAPAGAGYVCDSGLGEINQGSISGYDTRVFLGTTQVAPFSFATELVDLGVNTARFNFFPFSGDPTDVYDVWISETADGPALSSGCRRENVAGQSIAFEVDFVDRGRCVIESGEEYYLNLLMVQPRGDNTSSQIRKGIRVSG